ncbi:MAG: sugar isomerase [candidate division WS1 bacterium]|jgi:L-rhamnose isomerase/sugar isomerase|nr:sugar isomerase [candidate division WS1 bacterium]
MRDFAAEYRLLADRLMEKGLDVEQIKARLKAQEIETPSWGYSDAGTRFGRYPQAGAAVTAEEKLADAAQVHKYTGIAPGVAVHVKWDFPDGFDPAICQLAESLGVRIGAINPTCFSDEEGMMGTIANPDPRIRQRAVDHMLESIEIGRQAGSANLSLWFTDGTNYPGQDDILQRRRRVTESLQTVYAAMPESMQMLIEYKPFEPAFYHTDIADWGMAYLFAKSCGERAKVLVDLGHHLHGTNIEHLVAVLLDERMLGGFHFNNARYADDDLMIGSVNPYQDFLIFDQLVAAELRPDPAPIAYMIDQSLNVEPKIPGMIQSCLHIQRTYARALLVDRQALAQAQAEADIIAVGQVLTDAYQTDVEPLLVAVREELGLAPDPLAAYLNSGYQERIARERGIRSGGGGLG